MGKSDVREAQDGLQLHEFILLTLPHKPCFSLVTCFVHILHTSSLPNTETLQHTQTQSH